ncbi:MAG: Ppx/GppA family phosphatase, partial [Solirubrobacterales bacterium]
STRVAVIDIGTNSTRLLVADVGNDGIEEVERISTVTRLGRGVDHSGNLSAEAIEDVCEVIGQYLERIDALVAAPVSVIATSAVRDAANGGAFVAELRERFGLDTEVLSGEREAELTYLGAISGGGRDGSILVCDIGGGSTEVVLGTGGEIAFHASLQIGVVRHTERFLADDPPTAAQLDALASDVHERLGEALAGISLPPIERAVGVAGTPSSLAAVDLALEPYDPKAVEGHPLTLETVQTWLSRLASVPLAERREVTGIHPDRAQAIVAGLVILIEVMRAFDLEQIEVSEHDILYGSALAAAGLGS